MVQINLYQSPEGATPDFQCYKDDCSWRQWNCINPPKGPRPISRTSSLVGVMLFKMYQSPEGATPDFQHQKVQLLSLFLLCINPPKGPRPISRKRDETIARV